MVQIKISMGFSVAKKLKIFRFRIIQPIIAQKKIVVVKSSFVPFYLSTISIGDILVVYNASQWCVHSLCTSSRSLLLVLADYYKWNFYHQILIRKVRRI